MTDPTPIAWRAIVYGTPVVAADGTRLGTVREVLGSDADDIFHGVRVGTGWRTRSTTPWSRPSGSRPSATTAIATNVAATEALPAYDEASTYHLASVGWLRKHLGWVKDQDRDEEPG